MMSSLAQRSREIRQEMYRACDIINWGDVMKKNAVMLYLAIILGLIFPSMLFSHIENISNKKPNDNAFVETTAPEMHDTVRILVKHGEVVKEMDMEEYILGVVMQEMPSSFHTEALKAQAVVARTYAARSLTREKHPDADICTDPSCCQGYCEPERFADKGISEDDLEKLKAAVEDTTGYVLTYKGDLIEATYFSCSGGKTEDAVQVWGSDVPYLKSTESPGEEFAAHYTDTVQMTVRELEGKLGVSFSGAGGERIEKIIYTNGGGVDSAVIGGKKFTGVELRSLLNLRSTSFRITLMGDTVTITTKGYGHRVGMSQYGAEAMALAGESYCDILMHYYSGVELSKKL